MHNNLPKANDSANEHASNMAVNDRDAKQHTHAAESENDYLQTNGLEQGQPAAFGDNQVQASRYFRNPCGMT